MGYHSELVNGVELSRAGLWAYADLLPMFGGAPSKAPAHEVSSGPLPPSLIARPTCTFELA
jgi:hypothetical protein